jgi:hypothetical protein
LTLRGPAGTRRRIAGSSMKRTSRSPGRWIHLYRSIDQHGQVIDVLVSERRDGPAAHRSSLGRRRWAQLLAGSLRTGHRSVHESPMNWFRARDTCSSGTRTAASSPITVGSRRGFVRCGADDDPLCAHDRIWPLIRAAPAKRTLRSRHRPSGPRPPDRQHLPNLRSASERRGRPVQADLACV